MSMLEIAKTCSSRLKFDFPYDIEYWCKNMDMMMENYHKHTSWSDIVQIDSATDIEEFMQLSTQYGCQCYFSGEHGYPGEWLYVYDVCKNTFDKNYRNKKRIVHPLKFRYSAEVYWVKDILQTSVETYIDKKGIEKTREKKDNANCHMVIIAKNYNAMRKLNYIISCAHDQGFYYKPRIDLNMLFSNFEPDDIYITSACVAGWKYEDAKDIWLKIWNYFGDNFFFEYQTNNTPEQKKINKEIYELSQKYGIQTIIGLDTHYISDEDKIKRENLLLRKGISYPEEEGWYMDFPTGKTALQRMREQNVLPDEEIIYSMMNTHVFVGGCEELSYDTEFKIPILDEYKNYSYEQRCDELKVLLEKKYQNEDEEHKAPERFEGMKYEFGEIKGSNCADYFLDNYRLVDLAVNKYHGQLTPTSRGSASSYYSSKLLGFTTMDRFEAEVPIYPERFITKERILSSHQMPDIDLNCGSQEPFVSAAKELFGEHGCYPLLAVGKLGEKSGFKLYADVRGVTPSVANEITSAIDRYNEALKQVDDEEDKKDIHIEEYITDKKHLEIFNDSKSYQGIIEQAKVHACGHLIFNGNTRQRNVVGYGDIRYEIGLIRCHSESTGRSTIVANVEGNLLDAYGYVKDDFLIVDIVSIIYKLYESIGMKVPTVSQLRKMVQGDNETWNLYAIGATCCLNQCEKASTTKKVMKYKPKEIKELAAFIAGIRPGFKSLLDGFLNRVEHTNGEKAIDELLKDCFHYMLYQEAVMKIFSWLGIEMKDSYDTIKKISKKKLKGEALQKLESNLKSHWMQNIGNTDNFESVYKVIKDSGRYSFNGPHALAMANDSLYEAWVKAHHTANFYEVTLNHYANKNDKNKVSELEKEAMRIFGYSIGTFEYGKDNSKFTVSEKDKTIYPSISSIKGIGEKAASAIFDIYKKGYNDFVDIYIATNGTKINGSVFRKLIQIGYFEKFGTIKKLLQVVDIVDKWKGQKWEGKKNISKTEISELGLDEVNIDKFATDKLKSGKVSQTQYKIFDWIGLIKEIVKKIPNDEFPLSILLEYQCEILGYIKYINPALSPRHIVVMNLDTTYSPKFDAYSLSTGQICEMKIHKKIPRNDKRAKISFAELPVKNGDILYMTDCKKEIRKTKNKDGDWVEIPGEFSWWLKDYTIINL